MTAPRIQQASVILSLAGMLCGIGVAGAAETQAEPSLVGLATQVRPDFKLGSFASGLDFGQPYNPPRAEFFHRNFNIMTVGVYMKSTQRTPDRFDLEKVDALIDFATENDIRVSLHPLIGGWQYTPSWVNDGDLSRDELLQLLRDRITTILTRYRGRMHSVDVVNEALSGTGRKPDGTFDWQDRAWKGGDHVWFKTLGMWQGKRHELPLYLVEAFRTAREAAGPDMTLLLNEWGNETAKALRADAFLDLMLALREEGVPVDAAGFQLHCRVKDGVFCDWLRKPFDYDAFDALLKRYEQAGIEVHISEFDVHLPPEPTAEDFEIQGRAYAEVLRHALKSPAVKSFKTWGFTDAHSWHSDGIDGRPLMLDEQLLPKPAYLRQVEMLKVLTAPGR